MAVYELNPLTDPRWTDFINQHGEASIFHTAGWLDALQRTYGYTPVAFTTSNGSELTNAIVCCEVTSWLTGRRLVSLPFSDHCQPLATGDDLAGILDYLKAKRLARRAKYVEFRSIGTQESWETQSTLVKSEVFCFHVIDLRPDLKKVYSGFHESCIRRKIKRAERESLTYESGRSEELLEKFRSLLLLTRRRHKLPPQPAEWFRNLVQCLGDAVTIHLASQGATPVASILTLRHKNTLVYKYGCSNGEFNNLGGTPLLFWKAIQEAKQAGLEQFDLGRSDADDAGLTSFKNHLGAKPSQLVYYRDQDMRREVKTPQIHQSVSAWARNTLARLPDFVLAGVGQVLYRHIG